MADMNNPLLSSEQKLADEAGEGNLSHGPSRHHWQKAKAGVMTMVKVKTKALSWARDTKLMRGLKTEAEKQALIIRIITAITVLGVIMAMSKSALFHMKAVGRWDDGHAYKFSYALSLTMIVFVLKMMLAPIKNCLKPVKDKGQEVVEPALEEEEGPKTILQRLMPWILLVTFTTFEMLMATLSGLGLLYGAPTTIFVVFKSSKAVFMAFLSWAILGRKLNAAQWVSMAVISSALLLSTVAEGKGGGKKGPKEFNLVGPALLLASELCHAFMMIFQEIAVQNYWPQPIQLLSWSASFGVFLTAVSMWKSHDVFVGLPDGGRRPFDDPWDVFYMMSTTPAVAAVLLTNISSHLTSDVAHIMILKHISALARSLTDALKMIVMWMLGKVFWFFGVLPVLAEAWHPGLIGSWLMIPAITAVVYGMLMFKNGVYVPITYAKDSNGVWRLQENKIEMSQEQEEEEEVAVSIDDPFYMEGFRSKKLKKRAHAAMGKIKMHNALNRPAAQ